MKNLNHKFEIKIPAIKQKTATSLNTESTINSKNIVWNNIGIINLDQISALFEIESRIILSKK